MKEKLSEYWIAIMLIGAIILVFTGSYWLEQLRTHWHESYTQAHPHIQSDDEIKEHLFDDFEDDTLQSK